MLLLIRQFFLLVILINDVTTLLVRLWLLLKLKAHPVVPNSGKFQPLSWKFQLEHPLSQNLDRETQNNSTNIKLAATCKVIEIEMDRFEVSSFLCWKKIWSFKASNIHLISDIYWLVAVIAATNIQMIHTSCSSSKTKTTKIFEVIFRCVVLLHIIAWNLILIEMTDS